MRSYIRLTYNSELLGLRCLRDNDIVIDIDISLFPSSTIEVINRVVTKELVLFEYEDKLITESEKLDKHLVSTIRNSCTTVRDVNREIVAMG